MRKQQSPSPEVINGWRSAVREALNFIDASLSEPLSVPAIASRAGMSESHLRMVFGSFVGESVGEYTRRRRMEKAALALAVGDDSISEIALEFQFDSPAAFSRAFSRRFGKSPRAFRNARVIPGICDSLELNHTLPLARSSFSDLRVVVEEAPTWQFAYVPVVGGGYAAAARNGIRVHRWARERGILDTDDPRVVIRSHDESKIVPNDKARFDVGFRVTGPAEPEGDLNVVMVPAGLCAATQFFGTESEHDEQWRRFAYGWTIANGYNFAELVAYDFVEIEFNWLKNAAALVKRVTAHDWRYSTEMRMYVKPGRISIIER